MSPTKIKIRCTKFFFPHHHPTSSAYGWSGCFSQGSPVLANLRRTIDSILVKYTWTGCKNEVLLYLALCSLLSNHTKTCAYSNILKILPPKNEIFQIKNSHIFNISAQNIDCWYPLETSRGGGFNEYPQSMFMSRNKKINVNPCKTLVYYIKQGFKGVKII